jgi:CelD/BcsL family acetyltransferase involved in cellulose biosynthesis
MIRSYVVTFAFVTFRAMWAALQAAGVGTLHEQLAMASWFCWAAPLLVVEAALQGRKLVGLQSAACRGKMMAYSRTTGTSSLRRRGCA